MKSQPHPLHVALCCLAIATERLAWYATLAALVFLLPKTGMSVAEAVRYSGYLVSYHCAQCGEVTAHSADCENCANQCEACGAAGGKLSEDSTRLCSECLKLPTC